VIYSWVVRHLLACLFLATLILPWRWRQNIHPKQWLTFYGLHSGITPKTELFIFTAVRTSNSTSKKIIWGQSLLITVPPPPPERFRRVYDNSVYLLSIGLISNSGKIPESCWSTKQSENNYAVILQDTRSTWYFPLVAFTTPILTCCR
jgi:hypothetical protein